jgi:hypothetical protein
MAGFAAILPNPWQYRSEPPTDYEKQGQNAVYSKISKICVLTPL